MTKYIGYGFHKLKLTKLCLFVYVNVNINRTLRLYIQLKHLC